jgi:hypothetical protein
MSLAGVTAKLGMSGVIVIAVVMSVVFSAILNPDESYVATEKELVVAVVLGFLNPPI